MMSVALVRVLCLCKL